MIRTLLAAGLFAAISAQASAQNPLGKTVTFLANTPLYLEGSIQSPVFASLNANAPLELLALREDTSAFRVTKPQDILGNNLYFQVKTAAGQVGYIPMYYLLQNKDLEDIVGKYQAEKAAASAKNNPKPDKTGNQPTPQPNGKPDKGGKKKGK